MSRDGWRMLSPVAERHRREMYALTAWSLLGVLPVLLSGRLMAFALDHGFLADSATTGFATLGCYGAALVVGAFAKRCAMVPMATVTEAARDHLVRTTVAAGLRRAVDEGGAPGVEGVSKITSQVENVRQILAALLMSATSTGLAAAAALVGVVSLAPVVGLLALVPTLAAGAVVVRLSRVWRVRYATSLAAEERMTEQIGRTLGGLRDVVACGALERARNGADGVVDAHAHAVSSVAQVSGARMAAVALGARLPLVALLVTAPWLLARDALTPGELVGAATYLVSSLEPALRSAVQSVGNLALELGTILGSLAAHSRGSAADLAHDVPQPAPDDRCFGLSLHAATFRYGNGGSPVLDQVNLTIPEGEHLAVVGPSGTGKSTLANIVCGLEQPQTGEARLSGVPLSELDRTWLRRSLALVPQEAYVFAGTVRENLRYLAPEADDTRLDRAVAALGITELIKECGGYDGDLARPDLLSSGQRQLLALARVYLSPARVVILDEATCHLDPAAEERVELAFARRGGTLVVIAHRMSSAARARRVLVMAGGAVHTDTHRELLRTSPVYAELVGYWQYSAVSR
ncbi:ABC transporter ATP-binding protein [Streptomyces enissocaesilis]|uniref:ABC transporter ATP-binding protein n=1 Tax=Streptomyces enissocaesilis TaxID=332589 RepID=A0ABN3XND2_9ACTN